MGNCVFKGFGVEADDDNTGIVKVVTGSGGVMELYAPISAGSITDQSPGHAIFRNLDDLAQPLLHNEDLHPNELYYLLPVHPYKTPIKTPNLYHQNGGQCTPFRMSCDNHHRKIMADPEVFPSCNNMKSGVWKVNLVITPEQLSEILSQGGRTEELIDSARTVAKCSSIGASSVAGSEQWSNVSSRWN